MNKVCIVWKCSSEGKDVFPGRHLNLSLHEENAGPSISCLFIATGLPPNCTVWCVDDRCLQLNLGYLIYSVLHSRGFSFSKFSFTNPQILLYFSYWDSVYMYTVKNNISFINVAFTRQFCQLSWMPSIFFTVYLIKYSSLNISCSFKSHKLLSNYAMISKLTMANTRLKS